MHDGLSRRALLAGGASIGLVGVLAACTDAATRSTSSPVPSPTASSSGNAGPTSWSELAAATTGALLRPGSSGWDAARVLRDPRFDGADPLGILRAAGSADVVAALAFARSSGTPVALRSGGHSYTGWSAGGAPGTDVPRSLVISTADLDTIEIDGDSVTIGPGARLLDVYERLAAAGRAIGAGSCATVGIGGLTLGGGLGVLVRSFGLTCDQLTGATVVTPDGRVHRVTAHDEPDLFWACRGGGGGTAGVVTSLTFRTQPAPPVLMFEVVFPWSAAAGVVAAWLQWAPHADRRLWSSLKLLGGSTHPSGPRVAVIGTWTGSRTGADAAVDGFVRDTGATPLSHTATATTYGDAMRRYAGNGKRVSEAATSSIGSRPLTAAQIGTLLARVERASAVPGLTEGGVALDALGGAVGDLDAAATAFPWRSALCTAQYTATFADGADPAPFDAYVRGFRAAMRPAWGDTAYANYCDAAITDPSAYFGANTARLRAIASRADPHGLLDQPHWV